MPDPRPLQIANYRRLFVSQIATVVGSALTAVAVQQQIFDLTNSSALVGLASLVALVPLVVFGLIGGAVADTFDRRKLLMITSTGIALTSLALWVTALVNTQHVWVIMALLAVQQGFFAVNQPTRSAVLPRIVPAELVPAANNLNMTVFATGVIVGPLLVGVLIPLTGLPWLYFIDALTLTGVLYAVIRLPPIPPAGAGRSRPREGDRRADLPSGPPAAADDLRRRHHRHGVRHAAGAVPGHGRAHLRRSARRRGGARACSTPASRSVRCWAA